MSYIVDIAEALTQALNGYAFGMPFLAQRVYEPRYDLDTDSGLKVSVVPKSRETAQATRAMQQNEIQIDVGIQKKLAQADNTELDDLMDLAEEVTEAIHAGETFADFRVMTVENEPVYSLEHLVNSRLFTSVITVTLMGIV